MRFKRLIMCLLLCPLLLVGCNKPTPDKVESISIDPSFIVATFYVGQVVDLGDYTMTLIYSSGLTKDLMLDDPSITVTGLETSSAGTKSVRVSYEKISVIVKIDVVVPSAIDGIYKGETLQLFYNETPDFETIFVTILYEDGTEEEVALSSATVENLDLSSVTSEPRQLKVTYKNVSVLIPYVVSYREIELNKVYGYVQAGESRELFAEAVLQDDELLLNIYSVDQAGDKNEVNIISLIKQDDGTYLSTFIVNSQRCTFRIVVSANNLEATPLAPQA